MENRIAKPGKTLATSHYEVANFKLDEINAEFKLENRKKTITIVTFDQNDQNAISLSNFY